MKTTVLFIATAILSLNGFSQTWNEVIKTVASDRGAGDEFGFSVSISGDKAVVGAQSESEDVSGANTLNNAGAVYIFELSGGVWVETAKLVPSDRGADDQFGKSVDIDGDKVIVGAWLEDEDASGANTVNNAGAAYIFELNGGVWTETAKLVASDREANDRFAMNVSISGNRAVVGAPFEEDDVAGANNMFASGSAYIYELNSGTWTQTTKIVASDRGINNTFGTSVSMSGVRIIVGAVNTPIMVSPGNTVNCGAAYIFEFNGSTWSETAQLVASDAENSDKFGNSVSIDGDKAIVGAWFEEDDAAGANNLTSAGSAYVFELNGGTWNETAKLVASDRASEDRFGTSVSISGNRAIVGANQEDEDASGTNTLNNAGSAYIYELNGGTWTETNKLVSSDRDDLDLFGSSVSMSGINVIIGAYGEDEDAAGSNTLTSAGSAYIFELDCPAIGNTVTTSGTTLTADETGVDYQWLDCDNAYSPITGETAQSFTTTTNGNYAVEVSQNGCADTSDCVAINTVGLDDLKNTYGVHVYPNPASDIINIESNQKIETVRLLDINGQLIKQTNAKSIAVGELNPGVYLVQITTSNGVVTKRVVKQ